MQPLILNLAPTGMVPTRAQTPCVPLSPSEIAADAARCIPLGVSMLHLHARDAAGQPSCDKGIFAEIVAAVRAVSSDVVVVTTTSGRLESEPERRAASLFLEGDLKPDMASLTLGSLNFSSSVRSLRSSTRG